MSKLIKYEFKKTLFSKYVLLVFTIIAQVIFMYGVVAEKDQWTAWGIGSLAACAIIGMFFIGVESILSMHQDLNTKQSYMLFLTPRSTYQILGAKIIQNGLSIFIVGALFGILAIADFSFMVIRMDGLEELLEFANSMLKSFLDLEIYVTKTQLFLGIFVGLAAWLNMIVNAYLAIVLSATFFAGRKFSAIVSFLFYIVLGSLESRAYNLIPTTATVEAQMGWMIGVSMIMIVICYILTGWIMDKKLNV